MVSCIHSEPGVHTRSIKIPTKNYVAAIDWIKLNLPIDQIECLLDLISNLVGRNIVQG